MTHIKWDELTWQVDLFSYKTGHFGIIITETADQDDIAFLGDDVMVSIYIKNLEKDEVAIKNYNGFMGLLDELVLSEFVDLPHRFLRSEYFGKEVLIPIVRLKKQSINMAGTDVDITKQKSQETANSARAGRNSLGE
jgi:hypothetical protein